MTVVGDYLRPAAPLVIRVAHRPATCAVVVSGDHYSSACRMGVSRRRYSPGSPSSPAVTTTWPGSSCHSSRPATGISLTRRLNGFARRPQSAFQVGHEPRFVHTSTGVGHYRDVLALAVLAPPHRSQKVAPDQYLQLRCCIQRVETGWAPPRGGHLRPGSVRSDGNSLVPPRVPLPSRSWRPAAAGTGDRRRGSRQPGVRGAQGGDVADEQAQGKVLRSSMLTSQLA